MPKGYSVPCELCSSNIVVGLVYEFEPDIFICDECRDKLVKIEGFWFDGHAAEQSVHLTGGTQRDLQAVSTPQPDSGLKADSIPPTSK
jgi:hypothetical protein